MEAAEACYVRRMELLSLENANEMSQSFFKGRQVNSRAYESGKKNKLSKET
jgi:hypothetical protein